MKKQTWINAAIALIFLGALLVPKARADEWDKTTNVTFSQSVQVPGTVLPAGTYVFKLADSDSDRRIVQIFNADQTQLITTILAIPDYHMETPDKPIISFDERPSGQPEALRAWFYPGDNYGVEFVYPKQRATELAQANSRPVLSVPDDVTDPKTAPVAAVAPSLTLVDASAPAEPSPAMTDDPPAMPQTASSLPVIACSGVFSLLGALAIRRFAFGSR